MTAKHYGYQKEREGYSIWTLGLSGSRQDVIGYARTARDAQRKINKLHAADKNAHATKKKLTPQQAKAALMADGMDFAQDFHALGSSAVQALADTAKRAGYRKSKNAPGSTARMYYQYLSRVEPVVRGAGELTPAERRAYQARSRRASGHATKKSPAQLQREIDESLTKPADAWRTQVFNTHRAAQGFLNRIKKAHVAVIEEGKGMPLNRSHATMKTADTTSLTKEEKFRQAAKWIRRELTKRATGAHPSHLASKVLKEADEKFKLESYGVEGHAKSPSVGFQYLNYGDPYDSTIVVRSNATRATVIVAPGGWAPYA